MIRAATSCRALPRVAEVDSRRGVAMRGYAKPRIVMHGNARLGVAIHWYALMHTATRRYAYLCMVTHCCAF
eukprot:11176488-Lingulodinium_polyedra.AAC.1